MTVVGMFVLVGLLWSAPSTALVAPTRRGGHAGRRWPVQQPQQQHHHHHLQQQHDRMMLPGMSSSSEPQRLQGPIDRRSMGGVVSGVVGGLWGLAAQAVEGAGRVIAQSALFQPQGPKRTVVITGANSGVGLQGAKQLAARGDSVTCVCRTLDKAEAAAAACGPNARAAVCDLADLASVKRFAETLGDFDTLVLNAGLALNTAETAPRRTVDGFELTVGTNHLGHFALYKRLEPRLRKTGKRLVVTASPVHDPLSGGGGVGSAATLGTYAGLAAGPSFDMVDGGPYDADKAYKDSKLCNLQFTAEAARRLAPSGGTANAFSPGLIPSPKGFFKYQNQLFATVFLKAATLLGVAETEAFGGACLAYVAVDASLDGVTDAWLDTEPPGKHQLLQHLPSAEARDVAGQNRLWALSETLVNVV